MICKKICIGCHNIKCLRSSLRCNLDRVNNMESWSFWIDADEFTISKVKLEGQIHDILYSYYINWMWYK